MRDVLEDGPRPGFMKSMSMAGPAFVRSRVPRAVSGPRDPPPISVPGAHAPLGPRCWARSQASGVPAALGEHWEPRDPSPRPCSGPALLLFCVALGFASARSTVPTCESERPFRSWPVPKPHSQGHHTPRAPRCPQPSSQFPVSVTPRCPSSVPGHSLFSVKP